VFAPEAMEWDHLPGQTKLGDISNKMRGRKANVLLAEIAKCELVCANCHAVRTRNRLLARSRDDGRTIAEDELTYRVA
jgi:hypothetical protein